MQLTVSFAFNFPRDLASQKNLTESKQQSFPLEMIFPFVEIAPRNIFFSLVQSRACVFIFGHISQTHNSAGGIRLRSSVMKYFYSKITTDDNECMLFPTR